MSIVPASRLSTSDMALLGNNVRASPRRNVRPETGTRPASARRSHPSAIGATEIPRYSRRHFQQQVDQQ